MVWENENAPRVIFHIDKKKKEKSRCAFRPLQLSAAAAALHEIFGGPGKYFSRKREPLGARQCTDRSLIQPYENSAAANFLWRP